MSTRVELRPSQFCQHPTVVFVRRTIANGTMQYGPQCKHCGTFKAVRRVAIPCTAVLEDYDSDLSNRFHKERNEQLQLAYQEQRAVEQEAWWEQYSEYLASDAWKERRRRVLQRDRHVCQSCQERPAVEVHHLTYNHVFNEPLFDLVSVCEPCHRAITGIDRKQEAHVPNTAPQKAQSWPPAWMKE